MIVHRLDGISIIHKRFAAEDAMDAFSVHEMMLFSGGQAIAQALVFLEHDQTLTVNGGDAWGELCGEDRITSPHVYYDFHAKEGLRVEHIPSYDSVIHQFWVRQDCRLSLVFATELAFEVKAV